MKRHIRLLLGTFLVSAAFPLYSQEVIATSGHYFENTSGSLSFTLGEIAIETLDSDEITLSQGFQQPGLSITRIEETRESSFRVEVFPNPASSYIILNVSKQNLNGLMYRLLDPTGKILSQKRIEGRETSVNLETCPPGLYLLQIMNGERETHCFKVVKH